MDSTPRIFFKNQFFSSWLCFFTLKLKTTILVQVQSFLHWTTKIAHWSIFERKWKNSMKKWKPMFQKFLWDHGLWSSYQGRWRVTLIFGGVKLKISKCVFHHRFFWSRAFRIYLQFWNWIRRYWNIAIWRFWSIVKLGLKCHN